MIVIFPMLTSNSVSSNVLPGTCKMLEKYIIVYQMDKILEKANFKSDVARYGSVLRMTSGIMEQMIRVGGPSSGGLKVQPTPGISLQVGGKGEIRPRGLEEPPKMQQALALEPTWVKIEMKDGWTVLGVKVVPFPVQSDEGVIKLMMKDLQLSFWKRTITKFQRIAVRFAFRQWRIMGKLVGYKGGTLIGDPQKDILFAQSEHKRNIITLINMIDLENAEEFLKSAGGIKRLYRMGWRSFVILDDVKKQAHFCLEQYGGMCSMIPYSFIYSSLGKEHHKVYEDLEDIRKSGGAFFRMKNSVKKLFSESYEPYSNTEIITEDFTGLANRMKPAFTSIFRGLDIASKKKDKSLFKRALSKVPLISIEKVESVCAKMAPDFKKNYNLVRRVLANSLSAPESVNRACSVILAFGSSYKNKDDTKTTAIQATKRFVKVMRQKKTVWSSTQENISYNNEQKTAFDFKVPQAPEAEEAIKDIGNFITRVGEWIGMAYKVVSYGIGKAGELKITKKETLGSIYQDAFNICKEHQITVAIVLVFLALVLLVYLTRNA